MPSTKKPAPARSTKKAAAKKTAARKPAAKPAARSSGAKKPAAKKPAAADATAFFPGMDPLAVSPPGVAGIVAALASFSAPPLAYDPATAEADLAALRPRLAAIPADQLPVPRLDIGAVARAMLAVHTLATKAEPVRAAFEALASIGQLRIENVELVRALGFVLQHSWLRAEHEGAFRSDAKIPAVLDAESSKLEGTMQKVCEHNLEDDAEEGPVLRMLSPGSGYLDRANDLLGYADVYTRRHDVVSRDSLYDRMHVAEARRIAGEILGHLAASMSPAAREWYDVLRRALALLLTAYGEIQAAGLFVLRGDPQRDARFPGIYAVGRPGQGRPKKGKGKGKEKGKTEGEGGAAPAGPGK